METEKAKYSWLQAIKERGWAEPFRFALDLFEPLAPLASQVLYVFQPLAGNFGATHILKDLAEALESPEGLEDLRQELQEKDG